MSLHRHDGSSTNGFVTFLDRTKYLSVGKQAVGHMDYSLVLLGSAPQADLAPLEPAGAPH